MSQAVAPLLAALEQLSDAVILLDETDFVLRLADPAALFGSDARQRVALDVLQPAIAEAVRRLRAGSTRGHFIEVVLTRQDGSTKTVDVAFAGLAEAGIAGAVLVRDATADAQGREALQLLSVALDQTDRAIAILDASARVVYANRTLFTLLEHEPHEVIGRPASELVPYHIGEGQLAGEIVAAVESGTALEREVYAQGSSGETMWVDVASHPLRDAAGMLQHTAVIVSDRSQARLLQAFQRDVLEAVAGGLPLRDVTQLICKRVETMAPDVFCSILAVDEAGRLHGMAAPSLPPEMVGAFDGLEIGAEVGSCGTAAFRRAPVVVTDIATDPLWARYKDLVLPYGLRSCWSTPIELRDGRVAGTFAFYASDTRGPNSWHTQLVDTCVHLCVLAFERHFADERIAQLAYCDALTGLPNRSRLRDLIRERLTGSDSHGAFLFLDIDRFKDVNDTLGHMVGDRLLVEIARRIKTQLGPNDVVSRYGGDEFVILAESCDKQRAAELAGRIIEQLLAPVVVESMLLPVSASIGISIFPDDGRDEDALFKYADTAMYQAKADSGGTFRFFRPDMNGMAQERLVLGAALREAVLKHQLRLAYQPQLDCSTGQMRGVEALARWTHPMFGEVSPARFIALAEECGLIEPIGEWALDEACGQLARWRREGIAVPSVSVNFSAVHFRNSGLTELVAETLRVHGLAPEMLTIEITEGVIMDDNPVAVETAKAIHALGVRLSLDDFGTGYSSLSYLARLPIDELKIDRSFIAGLDTEKNAHAVVTAVVKIGQSLGLTVVAEGVEQGSQQRFLQALDCDVVQGFLISRALSAVDFEKWYGDHVGAGRLLRFPGAA